MTLKKYLHSRLANICVGMIGLLLIISLSRIAGIQYEYLILVVGMYVSVLVTLLLMEWFKVRNFYRTIKALTGSLEHSWQMASFIDQPSFLEGDIVLDALNVAKQSASEEIQNAQQDSREYHEYIEAWIHEVKTPLATLKLIANRLPAEEKHVCLCEVERIEQEVEQALWYARSTMVSQDYIIKNIALLPCVSSVCKKNARFLIERSVELFIEVDSSIRVLADEKWLSYILSQVIINAGKYDSTSITISCSQADSLTELIVADNGCGIPEEDMPYIFNKGFTGNRGRTYKASTGMGLYLAATMCEQMGIKIKIGSEENVGTRVFITFPHDFERLEIEQFN